MHSHIMGDIYLYVLNAGRGEEAIMNVVTCQGHSCCWVLCVFRVGKAFVWYVWSNANVSAENWLQYVCKTSGNMKVTQQGKKLL